MTNHTQSQQTKQVNHRKGTQFGEPPEKVKKLDKTADIRTRRAEFTSAKVRIGGEQSPSLEYKKQKKNRFKKEIAECENEIRDLREEIKFLKRCIEDYKYD